MLLASVAFCSCPAVAHDASVAEPDATEGSEIVVTGRAQRLYRNPVTTVGKSAESPLDIPQAVQVINKDLIADQGARDATDIYRNISGVSFFSYAGVTFRGSGRVWCSFGAMALTCSCRSTCLAILTSPP